jgi:DNA-binding XRE family transcriptional regulator
MAGMQCNFVEYSPWTDNLQALNVRVMQHDFNALCLELGKRLMTFRKRLGISQEELAFRAEVDRTYISQIERGVCNPSLFVLHKISIILNVTIEVLFSEAKDKEA